MSLHREDEPVRDVSSQQGDQVFDPLCIHVTSGVGRGATGLSAFDSALRDAGVADFNLVRLSSVIPARSEIRVDSVAPLGAWGDRLYAVYADQRADVAGTQAWAGIGWVQEEDTGKGLFVEHEGDSEAEVRADIATSLADICASRPKRFGPMHAVVRGAECDGTPVCALVLAVYETQTWQQEPRVSPRTLITPRTTDQA